jgi:hypothetical protein
MVKSISKPNRRIEYIGDHKHNSIVIGNYGDVRLIAQGRFDLSGLIYCGKNTVEFNLEGEGVATFSGVCKRLLIRGMRGNCTLDLRNLNCQNVWCESVKDNSTILLGGVKVIELISLDHEATIKFEGKPVLMNYSLRGNARINGWQQSA